MTTLAADLKRPYEVNEDPVYNDVPCVASDTVYEGAAVGDSSGNGRPLVAADNFMGFAAARAANESGSAGDITVRVRTKGQVQLSVTGVTSADDFGAPVYADDDNAFTLTSSSNSAVGKIHRWISGTNAIVAFEALSKRSI